MQIVLCKSLQNHLNHFISFMLVKPQGSQLLCWGLEEAASQSLVFQRVLGKDFPRVVSGIQFHAGDINTQGGDRIYYMQCSCKTGDFTGKARDRPFVACPADVRCGVCFCKNAQDLQVLPLQPLSSSGTPGKHRQSPVTRTELPLPLHQGPHQDSAASSMLASQLTATILWLTVVAPP